MKNSLPPPLTSLAVIGLLALLSACTRSDYAPPDEARLAGKKASDLAAATVDYCEGMDGGVRLTPDEIKGRNSWMLWTGGNERFWNLMAQEGYGTIDFLKLIDSRERGSRFARLGLVNEPGYRSNPKPDEHGVFLDQPIPGEARGGLDPALYGRSTGVLGLRLFPNPEFDARTRAKWDARRLYTDVSYSTDPSVVRPYRVGMTCAFCHVAPHPLFPPADLENPKWSNLSGTIGNQYFTNGTIFGFNLAKDDFLGQILRTVLPGTIDTSLMSTDYNNNPNIINGVFNVAERLRIAQNETASGGSLLMPPAGTASRPVPHVLVDGADTIGVVGALGRVFINIGTYSEEWLRCHNAIIGVRPSRPMRIKAALENSSYWAATIEQMPAMAGYLARAGTPLPLAEAPGGAAFLTEPPEVVNRGKLVFAENCFACHSSKQPAGGLTKPIEEVRTWSHDPAYLAFAREQVMQPDFIENNFMSTDRRVPITVVGTNAARALQDNAKAGHIWNDFSSDDYKRTPAVGPIKVQNPLDGTEHTFTPEGGGPGFYRVPSLVAVWTSAPFFHNNALGLYNHDPSVAGRVAAFNDAIRKLLWPERRPGLASVAVSSERAWLRLPAAQLPVLVKGVVPWAAWFLRFPWVLGTLLLALGLAIVWRARRVSAPSRRRALSLVAGVAVILCAAGTLALNYFAAGRLGGVELGPLPKGTPVNLLTNIDPDRTPPLQAAGALWRLDRALAEIRRHHLDDDAALKLLARDAVPALLEVNKAPDFVRDRGHPFGTHLPDADKEALIAFLKRL